MVGWLWLHEINHHASFKKIRSMSREAKGESKKDVYMGPRQNVAQTGLNSEVIPLRAVARALIGIFSDHAGWNQNRMKEDTKIDTVCRQVSRKFIIVAKFIRNSSHIWLYFKLRDTTIADSIFNIIFIWHMFYFRLKMLKTLCHFASKQISLYRSYLLAVFAGLFQQTVTNNGLILA